MRPGVVFVPFHYGTWDRAAGAGDDGDRPAPRAANELMLTAWEPVSKQPLFKVAAVAVTKIADGGGVPSPAPTVGAPAPLAAPETGTVRVPVTAGGTSDISWTVIGQAAQGARDTDLLDAVDACKHDTAVQLAWLRTRMKSAAPQALVVAG